MDKVSVISKCIGLKRNLLVFLIIIVSQNLYSQFGISLKTHFINEEVYDELDGVGLQSNEKNVGYLIGMDYKYLLPTLRIEPAIMIYTRYTTISNQPLNPDFIEGGPIKNQLGIGIEIPVNIYLFDLQICNCPKFNKNGDWAKEGFFIQPSIGYDLRMTTHEFSGASNSNEHFLTFGIGLGMDFPITKKLMITPTVDARHYLNFTNNGTFWTDPNIIEIGVRIGQYSKRKIKY